MIERSSARAGVLHIRHDPPYFCQCGELIGKPVWIQAGYELEYFPYKGHRVDFAHKAGLLPGAQRLEIKDIITEKAPASDESRIPRGDKQAFAVFTMPVSAARATAK